MADETVVVETGIIQCEHGGMVQLMSSAQNHVIGGIKPMHDLDLLQAPVVGCTFNISNGGQCTMVAAISSAITETNVAAQGKNYLLRVDGCKTDKGAGLLLVDPGQTNTVMPVPPSGSGGDVSVDALEDAKLDSKTNIKKEKYRIYPLRQTDKPDKSFRPLRGARTFSVRTDIYATLSTSTYKTEKVITQTDAYLYVSINDKTTEYKVVNQDDALRPRFLKVQFKDTKTGTIRRYIPIYEENGDVELLYSNIRLDEQQRDTFRSKVTPTKVSLGTKDASYITDYRALARQRILTEKEFNKRLSPFKKLQKTKPKRYNIVAAIPDPIGEVEDLYNEMETYFHLAYAHNKSFIDKVKERNHYAYSVAHFMDELELNSKEKKERTETKKRLKKAYYTLVEGLKEEFLPYIKQVSADRKSTWQIKDSNATLIRLNTFIEHDVAMSYLNEVQLNAAFLLNAKPKGGRRGRGRFEYYNAFDGSSREYLKEHCIIEKNSHDYLCLGKGSSVNGVTTQYQYNDSIRKSRTKITALTLFSLYFSGKHTMSLKGKYKDAAEAFHYNLKKLKAHPEFDDDVQEEINDKFDGTPYARLFKNTSGVRKDTFIDDYANLDTTARYCAYEWKKKGHIKEFDTLVPKDERFDFYFSKTQTSPKALSAQLKKKLASPDLKKVLDNYSTLQKKDFEGVVLLLNIAYSLTASRTKFDEEVTQTSPFNTGSAVTDFIKALSITLQSVDVNEHEKLYKAEIFSLYHKSLHGIITHALVEGKYNTDKFGTRQQNTQQFLSDIAPVTEQQYPLDLTKLNDGNIDKDLKVKQAHEKLFEQLKALDGITSQIHGAEDKQSAHDEEMQGTDKQKKMDKAEFDEFETDKNKTKVGQITKKLRNSKPYKASIASMKGLSFFITLFTTGDAIKHFNKNDLKSLLDISTGINSVTKTVVETGTKVLPRNQQAIKMVEMFVSDDAIPQQIIAKLAIPAIIIGAYYEIEALENKDYDAMAAITTKAALTVALAFVSGIWIAAAGYIALEILWYLFSSYFIDSKVEVMIERSLFFNSGGIDGRRSYMLSSIERGSGFYLTKRGYQDVSVQAKNIHSIGNQKLMREFIYKNYEANKQDFIAAAMYEFSEIYRALKNISIEVKKILTYYTNNSQTIEVNFNGYIKVNKEYYEDMKGIIYLIENEDYNNSVLIDVTDAKTEGNDRIINIFESLKKELSPDKLDEYSKNNYSILIDSAETSAKYELEIKYQPNPAEMIGNRVVKKIDFYLDDLASQPLNAQDLELLQLQG